MAALVTREMAHEKKKNANLQLQSTTNRALWQSQLATHGTVATCKPYQSEQ
jgi:hypothetical protein